MKHCCEEQLNETANNFELPIADRGFTIEASPSATGTRDSKLYRKEAKQNALRKAKCSGS
jgi:hypothetical protein